MGAMQLFKRIFSTWMMATIYGFIWGDKTNPTTRRSDYGVIMEE